MTEEEAQARWCPFARTSQAADQNDASVVNRTPMGGIDAGAYCIASVCMAWRKSSPWQDHEGYCGLAGKP